MTEKYYICEKCGELNTETKILDEIGSGGTGYCWCKYCSYEWDEKYQEFEPVYAKIFVGFTRIPKKIFDSIGKLSKDKRAYAFSTVPKKRLRVK